MSGSAHENLLKALGREEAWLVSMQKDAERARDLVHRKSFEKKDRKQQLKLKRRVIQKDTRVRSQKARVAQVQQEIKRFEEKHSV